MSRLDNKTAIVTGAASGFGAAIASGYIEAGARVVLADLNEAGAGALAEKLGAQALARKADVTRQADIDQLVDYCSEKFGPPDIVVNNAGTTHRNRPLLEVDEAAFDHVYNVNVKSLFYMTHKVVPLMRKAGQGVIINIGSTGGIRPRPGLVWYNGSKGAVNTLSRAMAVELGPDNIRVNVICPVLGETALLEAFMGMADTPENRAGFLTTIPLGRFTKPADVAQAAVFLASDEAEFLTGVELPVDGGRTI